MIKTLIMLGLVCLLATLMITDFIIVIPKFGAQHFGAPDDIKEMMKKMPDRTPWVNILYDSRLSRSSGGAHLGNRRYGKIQALFYGSIHPIFYYY